VLSLDLVELGRFFQLEDPDTLRSQTLAPYFSGFDLIISFLRDPDGWFERNLSSLGPRFFAIGPPILEDVHASRQFLDSLKPLGITPANTQSHLQVTPDQEARGSRLLQSLLPKRTRPLFAVHPGSGSPKKNWPVQHFSEVADWVRTELKLEIVLVTGEADEAVRTRFLDCLKPPKPVQLHRPRLGQLVAVLNQCRLLLGNDSGVSHLAAAVGIPVLALFGPTSPRVWRPLGTAVKVLSFPEANPERVKREIERLLSQTKTNS
jgi:ADP-heptose:LPS heptosyltransferase